MGRYPKVDDATADLHGPGWWTVASHTSTGAFSGGTITDGSHLNTGNWVGATLVHRAAAWVLRKYYVTAHNTGTSTVTVSAPGGNGSEDIQNGFGYFFQNHPSTLTQSKDWWYDSTNHKLRVYHVGSPLDSVKASRVEDLLTVTGKSYVIIDNIVFMYPDRMGINISASDHITVQNCEVYFSGQDAISTHTDWINGTHSNYVTINYNTIMDCLNDGIKIHNGSYDTIRGNLIQKVGLIRGMGLHVVDNHAGIDMGSSIASVTNNFADSNIIKLTGGTGVVPTSSGTASNTTVSRTVIDSACRLLSDAAGIYMGVGESHNINIVDNVITNIWGDNSGTNYVRSDQAHGIYRDNSAFSTVDGRWKRNSVWGVNGFGLFIHENIGDSLIDNTVGNGTYGQGGFQRDIAGGANQGIISKGNIFVATRDILTKQLQPIVYLQSVKQNNITLDSLGKFTQNYYVSPMGSDARIVTDQQQGSGVGTNMRVIPYNLSQWQTKYSFDSATVGSPFDTLNYIVSTTGAEKFSNPSFTTDISGTSTERYTSSFDASETGFTGGSLFLATSASNLYQNCYFQIGSVTSGTSYVITFKIKGAASASAYLLMLDNSSYLPIADATPNFFPSVSWSTTAATKSFIITPTSSATAMICFRAMEEAGNVWIDDFSVKPITAVTYTNTDSLFRFEPNKTGSSINVNLAGKVYKNGKGITKSGTISIPAYSSEILIFTGTSTNQSPIANAGVDIIVQLPTTTTTLNGSASSDPDGTITTYAWVKLTGTGGSITSPSSASTGVTGLSAGTYTYKLTVTDNNGATASDTVTVLVNIQPVASAGTDINIELPTTSTNLNGTGSTDADGIIVIYAWVKLTGTGGTITFANSATPTVSSLGYGVYTYQLTVTDNNGGTSKDTVKVSVWPINHKLTILKDYTYDLVGQVQQGGRGPDSLFDGNTTTHAIPNRFIAHPDSSISAFDGTKGIRYLLDLGNGTATRRKIVKVRVFDAGYGTDSFWIRKADTAFGNPNKLNGFTALINTNSLPATLSAREEAAQYTGGKWITYYPADTARYIIIQLKNYTVDLSEMEIYVSDADPTPVSLTYTDNRPLDTASFRDRMGTNIAGVYPDSLLKAVKHLREYELGVYYMTDSVNAYPSNIININPFGSTYDSVVVSKGFKFAPSIRGPSRYVQKRQQTIFPTLPIDMNSFQPMNDIGMDPEDPHSYTMSGSFFYKFMGVYGRNASFNIAHLTNLLNWDGTKAKGRYEYIEDGNEDEYPRGDSKYGNFWTGGYSNPLMYFARSYTNKNGFGGLLGAQLGAKTADPSVKFTMAGQYELHGEFLKTLAFLSKKFTTDSSFVWDVVNVHRYPRNLPEHADGGAPQGSEYVGVRRITSDQDSLSLKLENFRKELSRFIGLKADTIQWALTEIGADINQQSPISEAQFTEQYTITAAPVFTGLDSLQSQAVTLFRDYRHFMRTKWSFLNQYVFENPGGTQNNSVQNFGSSGLLTNTIPPGASKQLFPSWYYHAQIDGYLANYKYSSTLSEGENVAVVDKWVHKTRPDSAVYIVYRGSTNGGTVPYNITGLTGQIGVKKAVFSFSSKIGTESALSIVGGTLSTTATEIPTLYFVSSNISPLANAGSDVTVALPATPTVLSGSGSDPDGTITYAWTQVSGPNSVTIGSSTTATPSLSGYIVGSYTLKLTVTDNYGATALDTMTLTITAGNIAPSASAGIDKTITLPTNSTSATGTASDPDGTFTTLWSQVSGPNTAGISAPTSLTTNFTGLIAGIYFMKFTVTDNLGAITRDTMKITVNSGGNIAPIANAGADTTLMLPLNTVMLNGSLSSDPDGTIASYSWAKVSGEAYSINNASIASPVVSNLLQGTYIFRLTVTDNLGSVSTDDVTVIVTKVGTTINVRGNIKINIE